MKRLAVFALIACFVFPPTLLAGKGKKKDKRYDDRAPLIFVDDERDAVRLYFVESTAAGIARQGWPRRTTGACLQGRPRNGIASATDCRLGSRELTSLLGRE